MKKTITNQEVAALSNASVYPFPKYTTMLINQINQTAQGTRPKVVGQMSELIRSLTDRLWMNGNDGTTVGNRKPLTRLLQKFTPNS